MLATTATATAITITVTPLAKRPGVFRASTLGRAARGFAPAAARRRPRAAAPRCVARRNTDPALCGSRLRRAALHGRHRGKTDSGRRRRGLWLPQAPALEATADHG